MCGPRAAMLSLAGGTRNEKRAVPTTPLLWASSARDDTRQRTAQMPVLYFQQCASCWVRSTRVLKDSGTARHGCRRGTSILPPSRASPATHKHSSVRVLLRFARTVCAHGITQPVVCTAAWRADIALACARRRRGGVGGNGAAAPHIPLAAQPPVPAHSAASRGRMRSAAEPCCSGKLARVAVVGI